MWARITSYTVSFLLVLSTQYVPDITIVVEEITIITLLITTIMVISLFFMY